MDQISIKLNEVSKLTTWGKHISTVDSITKYKENWPLLQTHSWRFRRRWSKYLLLPKIQSNRSTLSHNIVQHPSYHVHNNNWMLLFVWTLILMFSSEATQSKRETSLFFVYQKSIGLMCFWPIFISQLVRVIEFPIQLE